MGSGVGEQHLIKSSVSNTGMETETQGKTLIISISDMMSPIGVVYHTLCYVTLISPLC